MFKKVVTFILLACISGLSYAEANWVHIGSSNEHIFAIDHNSISQVSQYPYTNYKKAWVKSVIYNDVTKDGMTVKDYSMVLYWANCQGQAIGTKSITDYKSNGSVYGRSYTPSYVDMKDVVPDSIGSSILDAICN